MATSSSYYCHIKLFDCLSNDLKVVSVTAQLEREKKGLPRISGSQITRSGSNVKFHTGSAATKTGAIISLQHRGIS